MSIDPTTPYVFRALDQHDSPDPQHGRKSAIRGAHEGSFPHADLGTAEVGALPVVRYWTVKFRRYGRAESHYAHVIACDPWKATMVVGNRDQSIVEAVDVREIDREEFEHLTRVPV